MFELLKKLGITYDANTVDAMIEAVVFILLITIKAKTVTATTGTTATE